MKRIAITQRVEEKKSYNEKRDVLDQKWIDFLLSIEIWPILVPNNLQYVKKFIKSENIDGVLFTGGNSLVRYGGDAPERDEVERFILNWALESNVPLLGVCRGMQIIQDYFGYNLSNISGHVGVRHSLDVIDNCRLSEALKRYSDVNSYNNFGSRKEDGNLLKIATSSDGIIMAVEHQEKNIFGIMWHSEREFPFRREDKLLFKDIFIGEK
ncbi:gamma-glutamyl-gamma-aminobutyrate hydrolase family protein [Candidatus Pseudothioglobus singularis]|nr:gamma-glutamyl-gamma-aminobutyrate hydrolase family protein [Candidatus Pseudothioglobus singularis]